MILLKKSTLAMQLWLILLVTACGSPARGEPTATGTAAAIFTETKALKPTETMTPEPPATSTQRPSPTPSPTLSATPTQPPPPTVTPDLVGTVVASTAPQVLGSYLSPKGEWRAEIVRYDCVPVGEENVNAYEELKLIQVKDGIEKIVDIQLQFCGGLGGYGFEGLFWSSNERYFYYSGAREGVPDGCGYWERPVIRLDSMDQRLVELGGGPLSPDGTMLATWQGQELVVWDLNKGEIDRIPAVVSSAQLGPISWSPDSQSLIYLQVESHCPLSGKSYLVRLELPDFNADLLFESEMPTFGKAVWENANEIKLVDENGRNWKYSFLTSNLEPIS